MKPTQQILNQAVVAVHGFQDGAELPVLINQIDSKSAKVAVIGMGYVGLPLALAACEAGFEVCGFEIDPEKVLKLNSGKSYVRDVSDSELLGSLSTGRFSANSDLLKLKEFQVIVIAVPTPLDKALIPDMSFIEGAGKAIAAVVSPGTLVSLESTTYPGTTEEVLLPILLESGLEVGKDLFVVYSPERVDPGNQEYSTKNTPKILGGLEENSTKLAEKFYSSFVESVVVVRDAKTAELVKVYENIFRSVNVAISNELALLCDRLSINVWEVIEAANTKPFGIMKFLPGPGVGGHCIPLDPHYLEYKAREVHFSTKFISAAGEINRFMPRFVLEKANRALNEQGIAMSRSKIAVLGVAYKKDIEDYRESPAIEVIKLLQENGADVVYCDPFVKKFDEHGLKMECTALDENLLRSLDLAIICTDHSDFDYAWMLEHCKLFLDTRNALKNITENRDKIRLL